MSTASITLKFVVPIMCSIINGEPKCNIPLVQEGNTWVGPGITITYEEGVYVIKSQ